MILFFDLSLHGPGMPARCPVNHADVMQWVTAAAASPEEKVIERRSGVAKQTGAKQVISLAQNERHRKIKFAWAFILKNAGYISIKCKWDDGKTKYLISDVRST